MSISLDWLRASDRVPLAPNYPMSFGKTVILRGVGYGVAPPDEFTMYRLPSPLAGWALDKLGRSRKWEFTRRRVQDRFTTPFIGGSTEPIALAPGGVFHSHRWQFTDLWGNWSPIVRTTRVATVKTSLKGGRGGVNVGIAADVLVSADPYVRLDLSFPWPSDDIWISPQSLLEEELADLNMMFGDVVSPSEVLQTLSEFLPAERPDGVDLQWERVEADLDEGDGLSGQLLVSATGSQPFAFCFIASDGKTGDVLGSSDVGVIWRDPSGSPGVVGLDG